MKLIPIANGNENFYQMPFSLSLSLAFAWFETKSIGLFAKRSFASFEQRNDVDARSERMCVRLVKWHCLCLQLSIELLIYFGFLII